MCVWYYLSIELGVYTSNQLAKCAGQCAEVGIEGLGPGQSINVFAALILGSDFGYAE